MARDGPQAAVPKAHLAPVASSPHETPVPIKSPRSLKSAANNDRFPIWLTAATGLRCASGSVAVSGTGVAGPGWTRQRQIADTPKSMKAHPCAAITQSGGGCTGMAVLAGATTWQVASEVDCE